MLGDLDFLDTARGAEAFLNGIPAGSVYGILEGIKEQGLKPGDLGIFEELMDARSLYLTPNSTTIYNMFELNVKDGPIVVEVPPGVLGPVDDAYFRFLTDFGFTGPDKGKGGKYLFVHRDYKGALPTGITPAMTEPKVGLGSVYGIGAQDANGDYLDGGRTDSVTLPGPVPAKDFWSFMVYSGQTRSMLETDQKTAGLDSLNPSVKPNADGSYTMWFGPKAPRGHEGNWIQTIPGKSYNVLLRLYGPRGAGRRQEMEAW